MLLAAALVSFQLYGAPLVPHKPQCGAMASLFQGIPSCLAADPYTEACQLSSRGDYLGAEETPLDSQATAGLLAGSLPSGQYLLEAQRQAARPQCLPQLPLL